MDIFKLFSLEGLEFLIYLFFHLYVEAEHEIYRGFPATTTMKALEIFSERFNYILERLRSTSIEDYAEILERSGYVKGVSITWKDNIIRVEISGCKYAREMHPQMDKEALCPLIAPAMMILKAKYDRVKFHKKLSQITEDGSITEFQISKT